LLSSESPHAGCEACLLNYEEIPSHIYDPLFSVFQIYCKVLVTQRKLKAS